jgi:hypothetical protein
MANETHYKPSSKRREEERKTSDIYHSRGTCERALCDCLLQGRLRGRIQSVRNHLNIAFVLSMHYLLQCLIRHPI